jgi:hypothetical protein
MFVMDHKRVAVPFEASTGPEQTTKFSLQKTGHALVKVRYQFTITITPTSGGSSNSIGGGDSIARFVDWIGKRILKRVELIYNGNSLQKFTGKQMYDESLVREEDEDFLEAIGDLEGGDWTIAQREAANGATVTATAGNSYTYTVDLPLFFTVDAAYALHVNALSHDPTLEIEHEKALYVIETDFLSATYTISNQKILCFYLNHTQEDKQHILSEIMTRQDGYLYMMLDHETQQTAVAADATSAEQTFTSIRGAVVELRFSWIRNVNWQTSTYENDPAAYEKITDFSMTGSAADILGHGSHTISSDDILKYMMKQLFHPRAVHGARLYAVSFAFEPDHKIDRSGSLNFGK